ncbi:MAG: hypothetical protein WEE20_14170 [Bacteroidota bacterium]
MRVILPLVFFVVFSRQILTAQTTLDSAQYKLSGEFFGDVYYSVDSETAANKGESGFLIRRGSLTYDYAHNKTFKSRFRVEADQSALTASNKLLVYIKDAYLIWRGMLGSGHDVIFGISPTPSFQTSEELWGYRSLEKTILDHRGLVSSRDIGIDVKGALGGGASYWIKMGNNSMDGRGTSLRLYGNLKYSLGKRSVVTLSSDWHKGETTVPGLGILKGNRIVVAGFLGYTEPGRYSFGVEVVYRLQEKNDLVSPTVVEDLKSTGFSAFASVSISDPMKFVVRYDYFQANSRLPDGALHYLLAGIDFRPIYRVHIIPNLTLQDRKSAAGSDITARVTVHMVY